MSHGCGNDTTRVNEQQSNASKRAGSYDFGLGVSRIAAAQICDSVGFHGFKESAMDSLAEIAIRYVCDLGKLANFYANISGRTQCNVFDIIRGLESLRSSDGYPGASDLSHCLVGTSGIVGEIIEYVNLVEEIPFGQPVPKFPVIKNRKLIPSFAQMGETPPSKHIPNWLPAFPDPHTYIHTPMWNERKTDPRADKIEQARQQRKAERSLLSLQQRLLYNGSVGTSAPRNTKEEWHSLGSDRALGTKLNPSENVLPLPDKVSDGPAKRNSISVLEAFAPAIEAVKGSGFCDDGEDERKVLPDVRPAVQFKFRSSKKFMGESLDLSFHNKGNGRVMFRVGRDEERDEKKRRAEYILRQSMENPH